MSLESFAGGGERLVVSSAGAAGSLRDIPKDALVCSICLHHFVCKREGSIMVLMY